LYFFIKKLKGLIIHKIYKLACKRATLPRNRRIPRAVPVHHLGIVHFHARYSSTAQKSQNPTRRNHPPLSNHRISRAGTFHRSGIVESHARYPSTAQESHNSTRWNGPSLRNCAFPRAGEFHRPGIAELYAWESSTAQE